MAKVLPFSPEKCSPSTDHLTDGIVWSSDPSFRSTVSQQSNSSDNGEKKTDWSSIYLAAVIICCCQVQFSLFLNSQFAFMKTLDESITEGFFGLIVGCYSLMQMISTPLMGIWADRLKQIRLPLLVCNGFMLIGNILYFSANWLPLSWTKYVFLMFRLVSGVGPGQNSLLIAYAASASVDKDRTNATAFITGGLAIGITVGPAFQWLFTFLGYPGLTFLAYNSLNMFTGPALFALAMNVVLHFVLLYWFKESNVGITENRIKHNSSSDSVESASFESPGGQSLPPYDRLGLIVCCAMRFTQYLVFTNLETVGVSFSMMMFRWTSTEVVVYESLAHSARGLITLLVYVIYIIFGLGKRVNDRLVCLIALLLLLFFHLITFSWPFVRHNVVQYDSSINSSAASKVGCDGHTLDWCHSLKQVNVWVYYGTLVILIGLAFPNLNVTLNTLFSRMIGPRMQTKEQGILELFGGFGRMLGPSLFGFIYTAFGPRPIWMLESGEVILMMVFWVICWRRLDPLKYPEELNGECIKEELPNIMYEKRNSFKESLPG